MMTGLKPYPEMKDTGVPWLGDVPEHWEVRRIATLWKDTWGLLGMDIGGCKPRSPCETHELARVAMGLYIKHSV